MNLRKRIPLAIWVANVIDTEDMVIRKRHGLPMVPMSYAATDISAGRPITDFEAGMQRYRLAPRKVLVNGK